MDVYDEQHLLRQSSDQIFIISDRKESRMSGDEESELHLNPSESDLNILQRSKNTSGSTNTKVDKGPKSS